MRKVNSRKILEELTKGQRKNNKKFFFPINKFLSFSLTAEEGKECRDEGIDGRVRKGRGRVNSREHWLNGYVRK